jgi:CxxC-x17-CxxC domain-containing protein
MAYVDKTLSCRDCGNDFVFTAGEQEFHAMKGFTNSPVRCPQCRAARKSVSGFSSGPRRDAGPREMHTVTCAGCGKPAQVPFVPRGDKPVYCSDCFQSQRSSRW